MKSTKIGSDEREIRGKWILAQGKVVADENCHRIRKLIKEHLQEIGSDASGWERLYRDPDDGRLWELIYPEGDLHGGGPPLLLFLPEEEAKIKYKHLFANT